MTRDEFAALIERARAASVASHLGRRNADATLAEIDAEIFVMRIYPMIEVDWLTGTARRIGIVRSIERG